MDIKDVENYIFLSRVYGRVKEADYKAQQDKANQTSLEKKEQEYALREEIARKIAETKGEEYNLGFFVSHNNTGIAIKSRATKEQWLAWALGQVRSPSTYMSRYTLEGWNPRWGDLHKEFDKYCTNIWGEFSYDHDVMTAAKPYTQSEDAEYKRIQNRYTWREAMEDVGIFGGEHYPTAIFGNGDGFSYSNIPPLFPKEEADKYGTYSLIFDRLPIYISPEECKRKSGEEFIYFSILSILIALPFVYIFGLGMTANERYNWQYQIFGLWAIPLTIVLFIAWILAMRYLPKLAVTSYSNSYIYQGGSHYSRAFYAGGKYGYLYDQDFWYDPSK